MVSPRLEFFLEKRSNALAELEELFNEVKREPQELKDVVFGSKAFYYKLKEISHDWEKLDERQKIIKFSAEGFSKELLNQKYTENKIV